MWHNAAKIAPNDHMGSTMKCFGELMPTIDELHAADQEHAAAIAALQARVTGHDTMLAAINAHMSKQDEQIGQIRETLGGLATKGDILDLTNKISGFNEQQLRQAHNSIPAKFAAAFSGGMFILALLAFAVAHFK
jgi:septal ring factor EnvC (AmiA/AmiB activator)